MKKELAQHWFGYIVLLLSSISFALIFFLVWPDRWLERLAIVAYGIFYYLWGIVTHNSNKQLTFGLIREYGLVALLGVGLLLMLTV